jgi:hypothetical protein
MGNGAAEPGSVLCIFQHGAFQRRNTDLNVRNQNANRLRQVPLLALGQWDRGQILRRAECRQKLLFKCVI